MVPIYVTDVVRGREREVARVGHNGRSHLCLNGQGIVSRKRHSGSEKLAGGL